MLALAIFDFATFAPFLFQLRTIGLDVRLYLFFRHSPIQYQDI